MGQAKESLIKIVEKMNKNPKAKDIFVTNVAGKDTDWEMSFQFNLNNQDPFFLEVKNRKLKLSNGVKSDAIVLMSGDPTAIVRICEGKGDFTHAISREEITVEKGKVIEVIRLTRAITTALRTN